MRVVLDACVLYPTVMREIILDAAATGAFEPLWSGRILEEWARAVAMKLPDQEGTARAEIALLRATWPQAEVTTNAPKVTGLWLPDANDIHVLETAIAARADAILTLNRKDFPSRALAVHNILRRDPDEFLLDLWNDQPDEIAAVCQHVRAQAERVSGQPQPMRQLLKKARMPRLGKALG